MKKILTLLIAFGAIAGAQAQSHYPDRNDSRDVILGNGNNRPYDNNNSRYGNNYYFSAYERDQQIARINRDYDFRIRQVERDRWMRNNERRNQIQRLEEQRRFEIRQVWERFRNSNNNHRDNDYRKGDRRW